MRGRPRKPTALKELQGTMHEERRTPNELQLPPGCPAPPGHLAALGKRLWRDVAPVLADAGVLSTKQAGALEGMCGAYAAAVEADKKVKRLGRVIKTPNGTLQINPWESVSKQRWREFRSFAVEFGLTPAAQSRVSAPGQVKRDPTEDLMFGKRPLKAIAGGKAE